MVTIHDIKGEKYTSEGRQIIWDKSSLGNAACLRKYKYTKIDRLQTPRVAANFGITAHKVFELYDNVGFKEGREAGLAAAIKAALTEEGLNNELSNFSRPSLLRALVWYHEQFDAPLDYLVEDGEIAVEKRFEVPLPGCDERLSGKLDGLIYDGGELTIFDRKFTKQTIDGSYFVDQFTPNDQFYLYVWALRQLGFNVSRFMIEAHQMMVTGYRCKRFVFQVPLDRLEDAVGYVLERNERVKRAFETGYWPMDMSQCSIYGGCEFRVLCSNDDRPADILRRTLWQDGQITSQTTQ